MHGGGGDVGREGWLACAAGAAAQLFSCRPPGCCAIVTMTALVAIQANTAVRKINSQQQRGDGSIGQPRARLRLGGGRRALRSPHGDEEQPLTSRPRNPE